MTVDGAVEGTDNAGHEVPPSPTGPRTGERSRWPVGALLLAAAVAVVVALTVLGVGGALDRAAVFDPGALVRFGLPAATAAHEVAAAVTIGLLVLAVAAVPARGDRLDLGGVRLSMVRAGGVAAGIWLALAVAVIVLTAADVTGQPPGSPGFAGIVVSFATQIDLGRAQAATTIAVAAAAALARTATRIATAAWAAGLALAALLPLALTGHAAGSRNHLNSVDSLAFHLVAVSLWVGGLAALVLCARRLGPDLPAVVARYSRLAGWCFGVVAVSGVINAALRLGSPAALASSYGLLVGVKTGALVLLGGAGWLHRRLTLPRLKARPALFARLAAVEVGVLGGTIGVAVALSRSAPPAGLPTAVSPVDALLGFPAPPDGPVRYLTAFYPDLLWLSVAAVLLGLYGVGVARMRRRGDRWPWHRSVLWLVGCLLLVWTTSGGVAVYGRLHFSTHMVQHMTLMVLVPLALVFGSPVTLALRTVAARTDGSLGPREALLLVLHSRAARVLAHPIVAAVLFAGGLVAFYYSRLFELAMFTHAGHVLMTAHFLLVGYLFIWSLIGPDPGPARPPYPFRLLILLVSLGFHAFFGISLMSSTRLLAADWWHALGRTDDAALLADQQAGGGIAWAAGDAPSLLIGIALVVGWVTSDMRRARQYDRQATRDDDAELRRYNERLATLARRDRER